MRILVGGMNHESNTLNPIITGEDDFVIFRGDELLNKGMLPYYSSTGIIETLKKLGAEIVPTILARAVPNGVVSGQLYGKLKSELLERAKKAKADGHVDGICLALHGSMKVENAEGNFCAEEDVLEALREVFPAIPISVALDMHATVTEKLMRLANAFAGYKTAPHIDCRETGARAAEMLAHSVQSGIILTSAFVKAPMLIAGEKSESEAEPMRSLLQKCVEAEALPDVLAASLLLGFPWADNEHNGVSAVVTTRNNAPLAQRVAKKLAEEFWSRRSEFVFRSEFYDSAAALQKAFDAVLAKKERPVFVSDSGDNPTAGSTGDATELFEKLLAMRDRADELPTPILYAGFYDANAALACCERGAGAHVDITLGGNWDTANGNRIPLSVTVLAAKQNYGPYKASVALVRCGALHIVITSKHIGFGDDELLPALGINASEYCLVVVKLGYLEPCFRSIAARAIMATSKGCSNEVLESIPYKKIRRPMYPLDPDMEWKA